MLSDAAAVRVSTWDLRDKDRIYGEKIESSVHHFKSLSYSHFRTIWVQQARLLDYLIVKERATLPLVCNSGIALHVILNQTPFS